MRNAFDIRTEKIYEREEGRKEGLAEGKAVGRKEGLAEGKIDVARKMIQTGIDIKVIADCTGLSVEQVKSLAP